MTAGESILLTVVFERPEHGGRVRHPDIADGPYRPHVRVVGTDELLGVAFEEWGQSPVPGRPLIVQIRPLYDGVDYAGLSVGASVEVVEGDKVVARGRVVG